MIFFFDFVDATRKWRVWSSLAKFDILKRYKRSFLGPWWITLAMFFLISAIGILYSQLFKLDFAKYAYDFCIEPRNYFKLNGIFSFSSNVDELSDYVQSRQ